MLHIPRQHILNIKFEGEVIFQKVPTLAIWFPSQYGKHWVYQTE